MRYKALLWDFKKSVELIRDTYNPAMDSDSITDAEWKINRNLLVEECGHLLGEIERLQMSKQMQDDRVQNVKYWVITYFGRLRARISDMNNSGIQHGQCRGQ